MSTHVLTRPDSMTIAVHEWNADADGVPVVLQHGFVASTETNWKAPGVVDALVAAGRRVISIDARGHGESGKAADDALFGEPKMAEDVVAVADGLGLDEYHLVGYSMGAVVALLTTIQDPRVSRLVIGGVGEGVVVCGGVDRRSMEAGEVAEALVAEGDLSGFSVGARGFREFADMLGSDRPSLAAQAHAVHQGPTPLDQVKVPTLLIAGRDDVLAVRPEVLADALPDGQLRVIDGDHLAAVMSPEFAVSIVDFLRD